MNNDMEAEPIRSMRQIDLLQWERDRARAQADHLLRIVSDIYKLLYPPPVTVGAKTMVFTPDNPHEWMQALCDRIRSIPDEVAKSDATTLLQSEIAHEPIKPIRNEADYDLALQKIDRCLDAAIGSPERDRLEVLTVLVDDYEARNHPIALTTSQQIKEPMVLYSEDGLQEAIGDACDNALRAFAREMEHGSGHIKIDPVLMLAAALEAIERERSKDRPGLSLPFSYQDVIGHLRARAAIDMSAKALRRRLNKGRV